MRFNQFIGTESSEREYKVGVIYWSKELDFQESLKLLLSAKWLFNDCIFNTIIIYLKKYLCKYIVSFTHRLTLINNGELYIGVDDKGFIKGIPYQGILTLSVIKPIVDSIIDEMLIFSNLSIIDRLKSSLKIDIIKIEFEPHDSQIKISIKKVNECVAYNNEKEKKIQRHARFKNMWIKLIEKQQLQIHKCINIERFEFLNYCKEKQILRKKDYNHKYSRLEYLCDVPNYYDMIADIKIKNFVKQRVGSIITCPDLLKCEDTAHNHIEINDVIALYNFGRYKDYCSFIYRNMKINHPTVKVDPNYPKFLLSQIETMLPLWIKKNRNINLYVIKITVPSSILSEGESISYFNVKKRKFEQCFRSDTDAGPTTIHLN